MTRIAVGQWRPTESGAMQVISGPIGRETDDEGGRREVCTQVGTDFRPEGAQDVIACRDASADLHGGRQRNPLPHKQIVIDCQRLTLDDSSSDGVIRTTAKTNRKQAGYRIRRRRKLRSGNVGADEGFSAVGTATTVSVRQADATGRWLEYPLPYRTSASLHESRRAVEVSGLPWRSAWRA